MKTFSLLLFLAITSSPLWAETPFTAGDPLYDAATAKKLDSILVDVNWTKADIATVAEELGVKSKMADPNHQGIKFVLQLPKDLSKPDERSSEAIIRREVGIGLTQAPITAVLDYICNQTNLGYQIHRNTVIFIKWHTDKDHSAKPPLQ